MKTLQRMPRAYRKRLEQVMGPPLFPPTVPVVGPGPRSEVAEAIALAKMLRTAGRKSR